MPLSLSLDRNANLERVLTTVVNNGMKAGWFALGHQDSEILPLLQEVKAKPSLLPPTASRIPTPYETSDHPLPSSGPAEGVLSESTA